jgi:hypothetical protein
MSTIPQESEVPGAKIHVVNVDGEDKIPIREIIAYSCDVDVHYAIQIWNRYPEDVRKQAEKSISMYKFKGQGQTDQPVISLAGAMEIIAHLPGFARIKQIRQENGRRLCAILNDHLKATKEGEVNAVFVPKNPSRREKRRAELVADTDSSRIRRRERLDVQLSFHERISVMRGREMQNLKAYVDVMAALDPEWTRNARLKLEVEERARQLALSSNPLVGAGAGPALSPDQPLSIADTIADLGYTATLEEALEIGEAAAESYLTRHLQYPLFEHVRVNGAEYKNYFFKQIDRDLVIDEIQSYICDRDGLLGLGGARS